MNRENVRNDVRAIMDEWYPTNTWSNTMLNVHINRAYKYVSNQVRSSNNKYYFTTTTIDTVAAVRTCSLPTNCIASNVANIIDENGSLLIPDDINDFDLNDTGNLARYYDIANNLIYLDPIPTEIKTYTLYYYRQPTELTADSTDLDFPEGFGDAVSLKAAEFAVKSVHGLWEPIAQDYQMYYDSMIAELDSNKTIKPKSIQMSRNWFGKRYINNRL